MNEAYVAVSLNNCRETFHVDFCCDAGWNGAGLTELRSSCHLTLPRGRASRRDAFPEAPSSRLNALRKLGKRFT